MSKKQKQKRLTHTKRLGLFALVFALLAGGYFAYSSFAATANKRTIHIATAMREDQTGKQRKTGVEFVASGGKTIRESGFSGYKNSTQDPSDTDIVFTDEQIEFDETGRKQTRVCLRGRDWKPYGQDAEVQVTLTANEQRKIQLAVAPGTSVSEICSQWQELLAVESLELSDLHVSQGIASIYTLSWEWR